MITPPSFTTRRRRTAVAVAAVVGALTLVPGAQASIPGPDGVIHGCYAGGLDPVHQLAVIDSADVCPRDMNPLDWNMTGPIGPPGPAGAGELPDAIQYSPTATLFKFSNPDPATPEIKTRTIPLPLGNWAVTAHLTKSGSIGCRLYGSAEGEAHGDGATFNSPSDVHATLTTLITVTNANQLVVRCTDGSPGTTFAFLASLVAIHVGAITVTPLPDADRAPVLPDPPNIGIGPALHKHLVTTYYSRTASPTARQQAQIALLAGQGHSIASIATQTFASTALVTSVIRRYSR